MTNPGLGETTITSGATALFGSVDGGYCAAVTAGGQPTLQCGSPATSGPSLSTSPNSDGSVDAVWSPVPTFSWL